MRTAVISYILIIVSITFIWIPHGFADAFKDCERLNYEVLSNPGLGREDGIVGKAVYLDGNQYMTIMPPKAFSYNQGTIMLWIKPSHGYYYHTQNRLKSHTFVSFRWSNGGYFVLSDGWWEKNGGCYYTYYVFDNTINCPLKTEYKYIANQWVHVAVTWESGPDGNLRLYINGALVSEKKLETTNTYHLEGPIYIGCDFGATIHGNRFFVGDIDGLEILGKRIDMRQLHSILYAQSPDWATNKYKWIRETIRKNAPVLRIWNKKVIRAVFDEGPLSWKTRDTAEKTIAAVKRAGFNTYIPCVWHGDGTRYPCAFAPPALYKGKNDPLKTLIEIAHRNNIEVHPWFTVTYRSRDFLEHYYDIGTPPKAFEIHNQQFRDFMVKLILDVIQRYDIDGINLDYIRSMGFTNSKTAKQLYHNMYNRDYQIDKKIYDENGFLEPHLQEFVDLAVKDIVERVYIGTKKSKPNAIVSVDGHPKAKWFPPSLQGRREKKWKNEGIIDLIFALSYERIPDIEGLMIVQSEINDPDAIIPVVGNFDRVKSIFRPRSPEVLTELVKLVKFNFQGNFAVYPYSLLTDEHINKLNLTNN